MHPSVDKIEYFLHSLVTCKLSKLAKNFSEYENL